MKINKHSLLLIIILIVIVFIVEAMTIFTLYNAAFEQQRAQLMATTQSQAKVIEAVARFDEKFSTKDVDGGAAAATLVQIRESRLNSKGFGKSGEFLFGKIENNKIVFLLPRRFKGVEEESGQNSLLDVGGSFAEPIQLALAGKIGTIIANDYRGKQVLAAYAPVKILNYGVVTKIDLEEIQEPFIRVGLISVFVAIVLISIGAFLFLRITEPMVKRIEGSATRLNEAQRLAKVGSWELNLLSSELNWSDEIFNIFEIDKSKFKATYEAFLNAIHPDDRDKVNKAYSDSLLDRKPYEITHRLQMSDGTIKYVHETCESFFKGDKPVRSVGTVQDITQLYKTEQELKSAMILNELVINASPIGIVIYDETGQCISTNESTATIIGATLEQVLQQNYNKTESWKKSGLISSANLAVESGIRQRNEFEVTTTFGKHAIYDCMFVPFILNDKKHLLLMIDDITERKDAEIELENHKDNLEELITERTKELNNAQDELVRKERLATLGQLTATVSHELRNPLGAMRPSLYVIEKKSDKEDERLQKAIKRLDRNIDRCDHIIDELLDFTRITDLNLHSELIDKWLDSVINEQVIPDGIALEKDFSLKDIEVAIDGDYLRRAIINAMENASHSMMDDNQQVVKNTNALLKIKTLAKDNRAEIVITDTGSGIAKDILDKIFEPLFSTKSFGVGLGMPTIKQIMQQHGGGIEVESEKDKGTSITLWLPCNMKDKGIGVV